MKKSILCLFVLLAWRGAQAENIYSKIGPAGGGVGNGNIVIEVRSMKGIDQKIDRINVEYSPAIRNYNEYIGGRAKKRSINLSLQVPKAKALGLIGSFAELGDIQSKSYSEQQNYQEQENLRQKIEIFRRYLENILSSDKPEPEIVRLLTQQIESLENQLKGIAQQDSTQALIHVTIKEKGHDAPFLQQANFKYFIILIFFSALFALSLFFLGLLAGWIKYRKKNTAAQEV